MKVLDAAHLLDTDGYLPLDAPNEDFRNAVRMAQCIEYGGPLPRGHVVDTLIVCRRRPDGIACRGLLMVAKTDEDHIEAVCDTCEEVELVIANWQHTPWAEGLPEPIPLDSVRVEPSRPSVAPQVDPAILDRMRRALAELGSPVTAEQVVDTMSTADHPRVIMELLFEQAPPRDLPHAQRVLDVIRATWNATPRPEFGGLTPEQKYRSRPPVTPAMAAPRIGRNERCPCGSGRKFKRCCGIEH